MKAAKKSQFWTPNKIGIAVILGSIGIPVLLPVLWVVVVMIFNSNPEFGEHCSTVDWLPSAATDVSYYKTYSYTAYEFKISEQGFKNFKHWEFVEISEPEQISRYNSIIENKKYHQKHPEYNREAYGELESKIYATVKNGIVAKHRSSNGGGYHAVYDRDKGIAYIQTNPR